jgi:hypothetical protein
MTSDKRSSEYRIVKVNIAKNQEFRKEAAGPYGPAASHPAPKNRSRPSGHSLQMATSALPTDFLHEIGWLARARAAQASPVKT